MSVNLVILGGGKSGLGAAMLAKKNDYSVFVSDKGGISQKNKNHLKQLNIDFEEFQHSYDRILQADLIVKSPGIPDESPVIKKIKARAIPIISEIEFAFRFSSGKVIAVTGSNGKTTTSSLIYHLLKAHLPDTSLVGNIGKSYAESVSNSKKSNFVVEVSSFQLDGITSFKPYIGIITNITPDHLERYSYNFESYALSKLRITLNQTEKDYLIYDADDHTINRYVKELNIKAVLVPFSLKKILDYGVYLKENNIVINMKNHYTIPLNIIPIEGKHNYKNTMAAVASTEILKIDKETIQKSLQSFQGIEHRLEVVTTFENVNYINDSKATNINSVFYALESMKRSTIWIAGGIDKGNCYETLIPLVREKVKAIICLGKENENIIKCFKDIVPYIVETTSMKECVSIAYGISEDGDNVLLSPACASFDLFENYEDRGRQYKKAILELTPNDKCKS